MRCATSKEQVNNCKVGEFIVGVLIKSIEKVKGRPARLINDKTLVPLRFLSEEIGFDVQWDENTRTVTIK